MPTPVAIPVASDPAIFPIIPPRLSSVDTGDAALGEGVWEGCADCSDASCATAGGADILTPDLDCGAVACAAAWPLVEATVCVELLLPIIAEQAKRLSKLCKTKLLG
mmetsp:Transcript_37498/g.72139  ORF Transcript_37498/g.72139 Transcript_37498/m.72139 type:complete len:107 (-) Transcript_37498:8-328(-)